MQALAWTFLFNITTHFSSTCPLQRLDPMEALMCTHHCMCRKMILAMCRRGNWGSVGYVSVLGYGDKKTQRWDVCTIFSGRSLFLHFPNFTPSWRPSSLSLPPGGSWASVPIMVPQTLPPAWLSSPPLGDQPAQGWLSFLEQAPWPEVSVLRAVAPVGPSNSSLQPSLLIPQLKYFCVQCSWSAPLFPHVARPCCLTLQLWPRARELRGWGCELAARTPGYRAVLVGLLLVVWAQASHSPSAPHSSCLWKWEWLQRLAQGDIVGTKWVRAQDVDSSGGSQ